ncbi:hypothetical protein K0T92_16250 [Paenibacillus oenotherae]|uniref:Uncharacterized protein n=1 Tax=Paenibacillus oenotherae TaxID=1435645 RepID=A0ABS7D8L5_9BACL|nr:hypothetical protein [Paenibacillus oenotherae]MBW7476285.1 hypothetical protein [Paenibacillus oenotherae]
MDFPVTPAELHWGINLGKKIFASSKPFIIIRAEANETLLEANPEGNVFSYSRSFTRESIRKYLKGSRIILHQKKIPSKLIIVQIPLDVCGEKY